MEDNVFVRDDTDLFSPPLFDVSIKSTTVTDYFPVTSISDHSSPLIFEIKSSEAQYIELSKTALKLKCRIIKGANDLLSSSEIVVPVNAIGKLFNYSLSDYIG